MNSKEKYINKLISIIKTNNYEYYYKDGRAVVRVDLINKKIENFRNNDYCFQYIHNLCYFEINYDFYKKGYEKVSEEFVKEKGFKI